MEPDLDDTRIAAPRPAPGAVDADHDDTVVRGHVAAPVFLEPPPLVEPPAPEPRPLPPVFEPVLVAPVSEPEPEPERGFALRLPDGSEVPVDVPVYVGRRPSVPRIHTGPAPRLVTLPSPGKELSATHVELRVVGGALVAADMRSTNGTDVHLPGSAPRTLLRGETAVVVPGTRIDLGEGNVLLVLGTEEQQ